MIEIVIASRNKDKFNEIFDIMSFLNCKLIFAGDFLELPEILEDGKTLYENACIKAIKTAELLQKPCIADDTGFFVRALNFEPGIMAARYAGEKCTYEDNLNKLLLKMKDKEDRFAFFSTVSVFADPVKGVIADNEGRIEGYVIDEKRGTNGFGYDPVFIPASYEKTYAEMTNEEKNKLSHRYNSISGLANKLMEILRRRDD